MKNIISKIQLSVMLFVAASVFGLVAGSNSLAGEKNTSVQKWEQKRNLKSGNTQPQIARNELISIASKLERQTASSFSIRVTEKVNSKLRESLMRLGSQTINLRRAVLQNRANSGWQIHRHERNGTPTFISGAELNRRASKLAQAFSAPEIALQFIDANRELFSLEDPENELYVMEEITGKLGKQHISLQQMYQGIPVWGHDMVVHLESNGEVYAVNARYSPTPEGLDINEGNIAAEQAIQIAKEDLAVMTPIIEMSERIQELLSYHGPNATQYIWVERASQKNHLIWHVEIRPNFRDRWYYFIDARAGTILEKYNATNFDGPATASATDLNGASRTINTYEISGTFFMIDGSRDIFKPNESQLPNDARGALQTLNGNNMDFGGGEAISNFTSSNNTWNDAASVSAHFDVGVVFEYYENVHNREAIDGKGSTVYSVVHITEDGQPMDNAFWNGAAIAYGDGNVAFKPLAGGLDVAGHELTHGVIQHTVNLEYKFQSGALNESLADVFGVMVDREDWQLGEDIVVPDFFPSGAMRDMEDPHNGGNGPGDRGWQPANMTEFVNLDITQDNGGVHVNSGIPNRACFLMASAIGREKTERIYFRVMDVRYLNTQSNFVDMRLAAIRAAADLFGDPSAEVDGVKAAFDGVGIVGDDGTPPPVDTPPVEGEQWIAVINADVSDNSLFLVRPVIQDPSTDIIQLTPTQVFTQSGNPISVTDDGSVILFVDSDNFIRAINSDGSDEQFVSNDGVWSSIALSPDGTRLAATSVFEDTTIFVFDFVNPNASKAIRLYTPTTAEGVFADVTVFADALDWDLSGQFVLYDAFNRIPQGGGAAIEYWDVNALDVDNEIIFPIFPPQPEGINIGNPSFAQTNDNFFVFDFFDQSAGTDQILAVDLFNGLLVGLIEDNGASIGFPRYSPDDNRIVFQRIEPDGTSTLRQIAVAENKIQSAGASELFVTEGQLPTWFAVGSRPSSVEDPPAVVPTEFVLQQNYPNPFNPQTSIRYELPVDAEVRLVIYDIRGREVQLLAKGSKSAGEYSVVWDGKDTTGNPAASGVYFYRLVMTSPAGVETRRTRKLTLLK